MAMPGRLELVEWLNSVLQTDYRRIESLSDGVAFLQLVDACHPGLAALSKLKFDASHEQDYVHNLGLLEDAFRRCKISRAVDVVQLSRCSFQYNLEMLQFLHAYVDRHYPTAPEEYPGYDRRLEALHRQAKAQKWKKRAPSPLDFSKSELQNHGM